MKLFPQITPWNVWDVPYNVWCTMEAHADEMSRQK